MFLLVISFANIPWAHFATNYIIFGAKCLIIGMSEIKFSLQMRGGRGRGKGRVGCCLAVVSNNFSSHFLVCVIILTCLLNHVFFFSLHSRPVSNAYCGTCGFCLYKNAMGSLVVGSIWYHWWKKKKSEISGIMPTAFSPILKIG